MSSLSQIVHLVFIIALGVAVPLTADATVRRDGAWPQSEEHVTFAFDGKPSDGLARLAKEAGWSLVVSKGIEVSEHDVSVHVEDQEAAAVLDALFIQSNVVAHRTGNLVTITRAEAAAAAPRMPHAREASPDPGLGQAPNAPAPILPAPLPSVRGEDKNIVGNSLVVRKDEVVHTVTVTGGSVKVLGTVTGDLVVAGGSAKIEEGAHVVGNATVFGGSLKVESGARVDGDVGIVGGVLEREEGALIGGTVVDNTHQGNGRVRVSMNNGAISSSVDTTVQDKRSRLSEAAHAFGHSVTKMALLFVLGCVLLALGTTRMERLRVEIAARPMKSFALGLVGSLGAGVLLVVLCITIVGIPIAILGLCLGILAVYSSVAAVLTTFGAAVAGHRTANPYAHLLGCGAFLLVSAIPYVGALVTFGLVMLAVGALVSTRLAGVADKRQSKPELI